jgi:hypothetical protein
MHASVDGKNVFPLSENNIFVNLDLSLSVSSRYEEGNIP